MKLKFLVLTVFTLCAADACKTQAVQAATLTTVVDGISNARGAAFGPDGTLYIGEPGIGGDGNCQPSPSTLFLPICAGNTGSVVKVTPDGKQERIFNNFQSLAEQPSGNQGAGPQELNFDSKGNAYLLTGFAGYPGNRDLELNTLGKQYPLPEGQIATFPPSPPDKVLNTSNLGKLFKADLNTQQLTEIFDFGKYEIVNNPDKGDVVSNPYDFVIGGDTAYVVDGGGNSLYKVKLDGSSSTAIALPKQLINDPQFPPLPPGQEIPPGLVEVPKDAPPPGLGGVPSEVLIQSVPTGAAIGPDGAIYVGEYTGFPYPEGKARIFRIGDDNTPQVFADGFTHITDLTFDKNGNLLVLQFSNQSQNKGNGDITNLPGSLIQLAPDGTRTTLVAAGEGLFSADGITIGPDNQIYVTDRGVGPKKGSVVRIDGLASGTKIPEPTSIAALITVAASVSVMLKKRKRQEELLDQVEIL